MKKRIVCLILTVVMLALSLVGCGYSYLDDDLGKYAAFEKTAFDQQIKNLVIKLGNGADEENAEKRDEAVWDAIYAALASNLSSTEQVTGRPGAHDLVKYNYYYTFVKDGITYQAKPEYVTTKASLQLGLNKYSDSLAAKIVDFIEKNENYQITAENAFAKLTEEDSVVEGGYATLTYKYTYTTKNQDGSDKKNEDTVTVNNKITADNPLHAAIIGSESGKTVQVVKTDADGNAVKDENGKDVYVNKVVEIPAGSNFEIQGKKVNEAITITDIKVVTVKSEITVGKLASLTYSFKYTKSGETTATTGTVTDLFEVIDADNLLHQKLLGYEIGKEYQTTVTEKNAEGEDVETTVKEIIIPAGKGFKINGKAVEEEITLSAIKVNYYVGGQYITGEPITPESESATVTATDVCGNKIDGIDAKSLKYYVYLSDYIAVDEYSTFNIVDRIIGKTATSSNKTAIVTAIKNMVIYGLGIQFDVDETDQQAYEQALNTQKDKIAELFAIKGISATESATVLDSLADKIADAMIDHYAKNSTKTQADTAVNTAKDDVTKKQQAYDEAEGDTAKAQAKTELDAAKATLEEKKAAAEKAKKDVEEALLYKNALIASLLTKDFQAVTTAKAEYVKARNDVDDKKAAVDAAAADKKAEAEAALANAENAFAEKKAAFEKLAKPSSETVTSMERKLTGGYHDYKYAESLATYRTEKQKAIVAEIFRLINAIEIGENGGYPEKAVDEAYDYLMNQYKYTFYNENYKVTDDKGETKDFTDENGNTITNYSYYSGSFKKFLIAAMGIDETATSNAYQAAKDKVRAEAQADVAPVLKLYIVAKAYGKEFTDKEFKQYKKENKELYKEQEYTYGEDNVRNALQFNKLMDFFLESEEVTDENYKLFKTEKYKNIQIVITKK